MEPPSGGGGGGAKRAKTSSSTDCGEDRLSALPDELLVLILLRLPTASAARTSVLSRRWRHVWTLLPELSFSSFPAPPLGFRDALAGSEVPLSTLLVRGQDASAWSLGAWLPAAARRVSGSLAVFNGPFAWAEEEPEEDETGAEGGAFKMPYFEKATMVWLHLGLLGLFLQPRGTFARLTSLFMSRVRFLGPCELGDMVSSPRCPCLQQLYVIESRGVDKLVIHSESLVEIELVRITALRQLTIVAPALQVLNVASCLNRALPRGQPAANISAPQLVSLDWRDYYDQQFVHFDHTSSVRHLRHQLYAVYGHSDLKYNFSSLSLLQSFEVVESLTMTLAYLREIESYEYLMEDMTVLPDLTTLYLNIIANGHSFGASSFHVLKMCNGLRRLVLGFCDPTDLEGQSPCPSDCICDLPENWETEELLLKHLQEIEILNIGGSDHEVAFMERLFSWVPLLKKIIVTFNSLITGNKFKELLHMFQSFSRPGLCIEFYMYQNFDKMLHAPEDSEPDYHFQHISDSLF